MEVRCGYWRGHMDTTGFARHALAVLGLTLLAGATPSFAAAELVTVFPFFDAGAGDAAVLAAVAEGVSATHLEGAELVFGHALKRRLRSDPAGALARCKDDTRCAIKLASKARTSALILGRARAGGDGIMLTLVAVDVATGAVRGKQVITSLTTDNAKTSVQDALATLLGRTLVAEPVVAVAKPEPPSVAVVAPVAARPTQIVSAPPPAVVTKPAALSASKTPPLIAGLRYGGIAVAGVSLATFIAAAVSGAQSAGVAGTVDATTSQPESLRRETDANSLADRANGLYVASGILIAVGGALLGAFFLVDDGDKR